MARDWEPWIRNSTGPATQPMKNAAAKDGTYRSPGWVKDYARTQIITVEELFQGKQPDIPPALAPHMTAKAQQQADPAQATLDMG